MMTTDCAPSSCIFAATGSKLDFRLARIATLAPYDAYLKGVHAQEQVSDVNDMVHRRQEQSDILVCYVLSNPF